MQDVHSLKAVYEAPYIAELPVQLCRSHCLHPEERFFSFEENFLQTVLVDPYDTNRCFLELYMVWFTALQPGTAAQVWGLWQAWCHCVRPGESPC